MSLDTQRILPLPQDVAAQIKSSATIASLTSVVIGLLENALDANAKKIEIEVDYSRGACIVEDDGHGIQPKEFREQGGLGRPCHTSKHKSAKVVYGGHGSFLAAVAALSLLTVTSLHHSYRSCSTVILHHSRPVARLVPAPHHQQLRTNDNGTRVTIQDLFGNMPVRVKQRAVEHSGNPYNEEKQFESLKKRMVALLIGWHVPVSINLTMNGLKKRKLQVRLKNVGLNDFQIGDRDVVETLVVSPRPQIDVQLVRSLLSQAGYIDPTDCGSWIKASARTSNVTATGTFCLMPAPSKAVQFISLGIRPLIGETTGNLLFEEINRLFAESNFGTQEEYDETVEHKRVQDRRYKRDGFTNRQLKGGGKGVDRWPMFYLRVDLQETNDLERLERDGVLQSVIKVIKAMVTGFLKDNHFRLRTTIRKHKTEPKINLAFSHLAPTHIGAFDSWSRIKSSRPFRPAGQLMVRTSDPTKIGAVHEAKPRTRSPELSSENDLACQLEEDAMIEWTNPVSKINMLINARTGLVALKSKQGQRPVSAPESFRSSFMISANRITRPHSTLPERAKPGSWANNLLSNWENPVFTLAEEPIHKSTNQISLEELNIHCCAGEAATSSSRGIPGISSAKLSKTALSAARIISQVDRKFILADVGKALVLIDQHAADERIRVENLLDDFYTQPPMTLAKALNFKISQQDQSLLASQRQYFAQLGIEYSLSTNQPVFSRPGPASDTKDAKPQIHVTSLPQPIAQRLLITPSLCLNLIRSIAWSLYSGEITHHTTSLRPRPPKAILDLLNSRACRSAIMFNDVLSISECEELVRKLARTNMPFVCAHGRCSIVPIVGLGNGDGDGDSGDNRTRHCENEDEVRESDAIHAGREGGRGNAGPASWAEDGEEPFASAWSRWNKNTSSHTAEA
ncbi:uncharacterized protein KY384_006828 [Bacidia gigantensis]|uniref:uncharacterized protein n=1 Tax=Bacidia gigantensis TaxID=2732470 RepID=UPI001D03889B|nr:uncharacterized protein KY384_006828 [Bacidia gigantensis]KAG8527912.1 hypothetical protein KY384_006828 [Bacidia gigantensis]